MIGKCIPLAVFFTFQPTFRVLWLCQICSETRELWKKTGAWFYRSLPNYEAPRERSNTRVNRSKNVISLPMKVVAARKQNFQLDDTSSSGEEGSSVDHMSQSLDALSFDKESHQRYSIVSIATTAEPTSSPETAAAAAAATRGGIHASFQDAVLGWIEISVTYDESNHSLVCNVLRARDLTPMDTCGLADPFCKVNVIVNECFKYCKWLKSKIAHKTVNPEFNELLNFIGMEPDDLQQAALYIVVLDDDKYGHDFLGAARFDLNSITVSACKTVVYLSVMHRAFLATASYDPFWSVTARI